MRFTWTTRGASIRVLTTALALGCFAVPLTARARIEGAALIGTPAPSWDVTGWINSAPLTPRQLRGHVVLIRWWTGPECPYCRASAPYLERWYETYRGRGLVVLGFYHHKSPEPLTAAHVENLVSEYGFTFPVAVDPEWRTLRRWWLEGHERSFTSVSFLLDADGIIRYVHPGGTYSPRSRREIEAKIRELLPRSRANLPEARAASDR